MNKKQLEGMIKPSAMERFDEIQKQIDPLYQIRSPLNISEIVEQHARISSASNIGEIARKAFQKAGLDSTILENQSAITRFAQSRAEEAVAFQDTFLEAKRGLSAHNNILSAKEMIIQSIGGVSVYKDIMASAKLAKDLVEPFKSSIDIARIAFEANESFKLAKGFQSKSVLDGSIFSEYTEAFRQLESLRNLESFKSIFRLKNLPIEQAPDVNLTEEDIEKFSNRSISEIDSDLNDEIKSGIDFSLFPEKTKKLFIYFYHYYLLQVILSCLASLIMFHVFQAKEELKVVETKQEVRAFTRSPPATFDRKALKGYRFTMVDNLNLRGNHSMDSDIIEILPIGTTVKTIDNSNRSWLFVEIEINGELQQGWVLRRYTTYFK